MQSAPRRSQPPRSRARHAHTLPGCPAGLRVSSPRRAARAVRQLCSAAYSRRSSGTLPRCVGGDLYARAGRTRHRVPLYPVEGTSKPPRHPIWVPLLPSRMRGHITAGTLRRPSSGYGKAGRTTTHTRLQKTFRGGASPDPVPHRAPHEPAEQASGRSAGTPDRNRSQTERPE